MAASQTRPQDPEWLTLKSATTSQLSKRNINDTTGGGQSGDDTQCPGSSNEGGGQSSNETRYPGGSTVGHSGKKLSHQETGSDRRSISPATISQEPLAAQTTRFADESLAGEPTGPQPRSLQRNGPMVSKGSTQHDAGSCKPCAFFCFSRRGCSRGEGCDFCHLYHESRSQKKREERDQTSNSSQNGERSRRKGGKNERMEYESSSISMDSLPEVAYIELGQGARAQKESTFMMPDSNDVTPMFAAMNVASSLNPSVFSYAPGALLAAVGQEVELWPDFHELQTRVFAVCPKLPAGLAMDMHTGVIHGTAQEATNGPGIYFVTCCEPCSDFSVSTAVIHVDVLDVMAQGYNVTNSLQHGTPWQAVPSYKGASIHAPIADGPPGLEEHNVQLVSP